MPLPSSPHPSFKHIQFCTHRNTEWLCEVLLCTMTSSNHPTTHQCFITHQQRTQAQFTVHYDVIKPPYYTPMLHHTPVAYTDIVSAIKQGQKRPQIRSKGEKDREKEGEREREREKERERERKREIEKGQGKRAKYSK